MSLSQHIEWAKSEFDKCDFGDLRLNKRVIKLAQELLNKPNESLPSQISSWKDLKAAYRFFNSDSVDHSKIQKVHRNNVRKEAQKSSNTILFIQDSSELDYSSKRKTTGLGPIGNHTGRGIHFHSTLAVEYNKYNPSVLGLAYQKVWIRENISLRKTESRHERSKRKTEADCWMESLREINKPANLTTNWVSVGDRGNDLFKFIRDCKNTNWNYLIRASANRTILTSSNESAKLFDWMRSMPSQTTKLIKIRSREEKPTREIVLNISWSSLKVIPPKNFFSKAEYEEIPLECIRVWEDAPNGLEWFLLTNVPSTNAESILEKVGWYETRWLVEEYHKCLKTGCAMEKRQLQTAQALLSLLGLLGIIATNLLAIKFLAKDNAHKKATEHIPIDHLQLLCSHFRLSINDLTCQQFWHKIASLGGFIGRKGDGDPGWQTLWKGWIRFLDMLMGAEALKRYG
jgi:Transposase DNA-binding/Transposase DDE domain